MALPPAGAGPQTRVEAILMLADVLGLGGVLAVLVKPVLWNLLAFYLCEIQGMWKKLTSRDSHLALIFSFSSSLANSDQPFDS